MTTTTLEQTALRRDRSALVLVLQSAKAVFKGNGNACTCPFHDDQHPSAGIFEGDDGAWRFKCQPCGVKGDIFDIRAMVEHRPLGDVLKEASGRPPPAPAPSRASAAKPASRVYATVEELKATVRNLVDDFKYTHPDTRQVEMIVLRIEPPGEKKRFLQASPTAGGFHMEAPAKPWPIYNRTRVRDSQAVIVVEGEKCVHALADIGHVATTSPGGAGNAEHADWSPLAGKIVFLWPDNDAPDPKNGKRSGIDHMGKAAAILEKLMPAPRLYWIDPDELGLPVKGDCVEYIEALGQATKDEKHLAVAAVLDSAQEMGPAAGVGDRLQAMIDGRYEAIEMPWRVLGHLTMAMLPGTVTVLCGSGGASKSFTILQVALYWHQAGRRLALYELEEDRNYHLMRALAILDGNGQLLNPAWVKANPQDAIAAYGRHRDALDDFGRRIFEAPDQQLTLTQLAQWVEQQAAAGVEIIIIDPITAAVAEDKPWVADLKFLMQVKASMRRTGARLVLVTHPRKGSGGNRPAGLDDLAGGTAWARFPQTVLRLEALDEPKRMTVKAAMGEADLEANRIVSIYKARNGRGTGCQVAMHFDGQGLSLKELGMIVKKKHQNDKPKDDTPPPPPVQVYDVGRFVGECLTAEPRPRAVILEDAKSKGLPESRAKSLLEAAEGQGKAHRWKVGKTNLAYFASQPQPKLTDETKGSESSSCRAEEKTEDSRTSA